jgi:nicotinate phosphoribosyltransferase
MGCIGDIPMMAKRRSDRAGGLLTDLYELTMAAAYLELGMEQEAAFELFVRSLPSGRGYLLCAGLEQVVDYLEGLAFSEAEIAYLRGLPVFKGTDGRLFDWLAEFSFTGDLHAVPEGTPVFAGEPILRVEAPLPQAQLVETWLLSMVNYQTLVASKAARIVEAACADGCERAVVDFGSRRAHGPQAGVLAARASYIAGCAATSNTEAGFRMGIPVSGTQAHSFIMASPDEEEAFRRYYECYGDESVMLVDTYEVTEGLRRAIRVAPGMKGVRIDSGDIAALSRRARAMLAEAGLYGAKVLASGDLDEFEISRLIEAGAEVDGFGVGTRMVTGYDTPHLGGVYKLVAVREGADWVPRLKLSPDKATHPGRKQVYRFSDGPCRPYVRDVVATLGEECPEGARPLLRPTMLDGRRTRDLPDLRAIREHAARERARIPPECRRLNEPDFYPVGHSPALEKLRAQLGDTLNG